MMDEKVTPFPVEAVAEKEGMWAVAYLLGYVEGSLRVHGKITTEEYNQAVTNALELLKVGKK